MAQNIIYFENPHSGQIKEAPVGFSWTVLCFAFFPPLIRGDWKWGIISALAAGFSMGISCFVFPFIYNKLYIKELIDGGFKVKGVKLGTVEQISAMVGLNLPMLEASE